MVVRIKLTLEQKEYSALLQLALKEIRNPEGQLRYLLCRELKHLGLLSEKEDQNVDVGGAQMKIQEMEQ